MARDILMPQMGYDMTQGTLVRWVKKVGDKVHRGDVVAEIETDKATVEIEAFDSGTLLRTMAEPGETLPVGQPIATLGEAGEKLPEPAAPAPAPEPARNVTPAPAATRPSAPSPAPAPAPPPPSAALAVSRPEGGRVNASPLARRIADQLGVDLGRVRGSGPGGRVVAADVEAAAEQAPSPTADLAPAIAPSAPAPAPPTEPGPSPVPPLPEGAEDTEPNRLRQAMARRMSESKRSAPHFYVAVDCRAGELLKLREELAAAKTRVSVNDMLVKALALATAAHPAMNAAYLGGKIRTFAKIDVGIAVATENGLLSPAIGDVAGKTLKEIAAATRDLAERARAGRLRPEEYGGGTVTLSNLGMYGVDEFLAIINPPQALIVSVGTAADRVIAVKGKPVVEKVFTAWAAADHRVVDGAQVGEFMQTFRSIVEDPGRLNT
ncbi:MAG: hypothetical protein QOK05_1172 [Chloroflexota bacterium]|jgi:pyruvate dehydrogenase E2 component (dihydrolipoamide acetyltransferase)|nr:hypothetical protein [Chloroflexota bacterium]